MNLGRKGSSNASGAFTMYNIPDGYWYAVQGTATFGVCPAVRQTVYSGFSDSVWAGGVARTANVRMDFRGYAGELAGTTCPPRAGPRGPALCAPLIEPHDYLRALARCGEVEGYAPRFRQAATPPAPPAAPGSAATSPRHGRLAHCRHGR